MKLSTSWWLDLNTSNNGINFTSVSIFASKNAKLIHGISTQKGVNYAFQAQRVSLNNLIRNNWGKLKSTEIIINLL